MLHRPTSGNSLPQEMESQLWEKWLSAAEEMHCMISWGFASQMLSCLEVKILLHYSHFLEGDCKRTPEFVLEGNSQFCSIFLCFASEIASSKKEKNTVSSVPSP